MGTSIIIPRQENEKYAGLGVFMKEHQDTIKVACDEARKKMSALLKKNEYSSDDIKRIAQKLYDTNKLFLLLYSFPMEYWDVLPRNILEAMYLTRKPDPMQGPLMETVENRSTPKFERIAELLKLRNIQKYSYIDVYVC